MKYLYLLLLILGTTSLSAGEFSDPESYLSYDDAHTVEICDPKNNATWGIIRLFSQKNNVPRPENYHVRVAERFMHHPKKTAVALSLDTIYHSFPLLVDDYVSQCSARAGQFPGNYIIPGTLKTGRLQTFVLYEYGPLGKDEQCVHRFARPIENKCLFQDNYFILHNYQIVVNHANRAHTIKNLKVLNKKLSSREYDSAVRTTSSTTNFKAFLWSNLRTCILAKALSRGTNKEVDDLEKEALHLNRELSRTLRNDDNLTPEGNLKNLVFREIQGTIDAIQKIRNDQSILTIKALEEQL